MMDTLLKQIMILAEKQPDKEAVIYKDEILTYHELKQKIVGIADILKEKGILKDDRVCVTAVSKPEMVAAYLGIQMCKAIAVFVDKNGTPESIAAIYQEADAKLLLTDKPMKKCSAYCQVLSLRTVYQSAAERNIHMFENILPEEDSIAELLFTSGTTGRPKGVILTYKAVYHILCNTILGIDMAEDDRILLPLPLHHSFALRVLRAALYKGATVILQNGFTFAKEVETNVMHHHCNALAAVPTSYEVMRGQMQDDFERVMKNMRYIEFSAGALSVRQRKEITALLPNTIIHNTWGSSESGGAIFCNVTEIANNPLKIATLGKPLSGVQVKILDPFGNEMKSDARHPGRMALKGDMQMKGYWRQPELTAATLVDGWLLTGDMAYLEDGYIYMLGRADDIIKVAGEKVSPIEVENVAGECPYVKECACIGVDDPDGLLGQIPVLFLTAKNGYSEDKLLKFLSGRIEKYKIPKKYVVLEAIPRNQMQKVDRKELKNIWDNSETLDLMNPVIQNIFARRSIRKFKETSIPATILDMILKAGYYAPSGHNMQSWRFTVIEKESRIMQLKETVKKAAEKEKVHFYGFENPRVLILVSNDKRNQDGCQDASCAAENIMLAANSYGIGSVWLNPLMTLREKEPVKSLLDKLGIPENHIVWSMIALGYPVYDGERLVKRTDVVHYVDREQMK